MDSPISTASSSDSRSDDSLYDPIYAEIDHTDTSGRAIALWSAHCYRDAVMFTPTQGCTISNILRYAEAHMDYNKRLDRVMLLGPGLKEPIDLLDAYLIKPGSVVMLWPAESFLVTIEINQLKTVFPMNVDPISTVYQLKSRLKKIKGVPIERQEILYRDKPMLNNHWLFEYRVQPNTTLHLLLQLHYDLQVNVKTFWGKVYRLFLDPCMTGNDLVNKVFNRAFRYNEPEQVSVLELYIPSQVLLLEYNKKLIKTDYCLSYFNIKSGETLLLTTLSHKQHIDIQTLTVVMETGEEYKLNVSSFDRWSVVAFMLHGLTDVPVDFIRLYKKGERLDFSSVIGEHGIREIILMNVYMTYEDKDILYGVPLRISLGNTIMENIVIDPERRVKDVKLRLEEQGVPNASVYELVYNDQNLSDDIPLKDLLPENCGTLSLKLQEFPIYVHSPGGVIYKTHLRVHQTVQALKNKVEIKSGHVMSSCSIIIAGEEHIDSDSLNLYENGVSIGTSIFFRTYYKEEHFFVIGGNWLIKLKFGGKLTPKNLKRTLWDDQSLPEAVMTSLHTLLSWFYEPRFNGRNQTNLKSLIGQRLPAMRKQTPTHKSAEKVSKMAVKFDALSISDGDKQKQNRKLPMSEKLPKFHNAENISRKKEVCKVHSHHSKQISHNKNKIRYASEAINDEIQRSGKKVFSEPITRRRQPLWLGYLRGKNLVHRLSTINQVKHMGHMSMRNRGVRNRKPNIRLPVYVGTPTRMYKPMPTNRLGDITLTKSFVH